MKIIPPKTTDQKEKITFLYPDLIENNYGQSVECFKAGPQIHAVVKALPFQEDGKNRFTILFNPQTSLHTPQKTYKVARWRDHILDITGMVQWPGLPWVNMVAVSRKEDHCA